MIKPSYAFTSDNAAPAHPRMIQAIAEVNSCYEPPYDNDEYGTQVSQAYKKFSLKMKEARGKNSMGPILLIIILPALALPDIGIGKWFSNSVMHSYVFFKELQCNFLRQQHSSPKSAQLNSLIRSVGCD